jgi:hypothetical protein
MSALLPKADIGGRRLDVRFVPKADSCTAAIVTAVIAENYESSLVTLASQPFHKWWDLGCLMKHH